VGDRAHTLTAIVRLPGYLQSVEAILGHQQSWISGTRALIRVASEGKMRM
jgi:hypothetical protein